MSQIKSFSELINSGYSLQIPAYQRAYSWGEKQIKQFINDLIEIKSKEYYYGHFILEDNKKDKIFEIVDGQQRVTTYVLFLLSAKLYSDYEITDEQKDFIENKFQTISYDIEKFKELITNVLNENRIIEFSDTDTITSSLKRICQAIDHFRKIFESKHKQVEFKIKNLIETLEKAVISVHTTEYKNVAAQIFELQNSRGISLDLIEKVKAKLMKEIYLYSDKGSSDKNIQEIQDHFSEVYKLEEKTTDSSFRGELKLDTILFHHLRVIDDKSKKLASSFHSPSDRSIEESILSYISDQMNIKTEKVEYILNLSESFKESVKYVCDTLPELDKENPLVGDCLILDRGISLEFFLILLHNDLFDKVDLKQWELLLFTRNFHSRYYNKSYKKRDNFPKLYEETIDRREQGKIRERFDHYLENGFRGQENGYELQKVFYQDIILNGKVLILTNGYNYWKEKMTYVLYKYEIEEIGNSKELRNKIRAYFKKGKSIEHILPRAWSQEWVNLGKESEEAETFRNEINGVINGIGNLLIINSSQNSGQSNRHPNKKVYSITEGSYTENKERWKDHTQWRDIIQKRGNNIYNFMTEYFSVKNLNNYKGSPNSTK